MTTKAVANLIMKSFHKWAPTSKQARTYKNTDKKSFRLMEDAFSEMKTINQHEFRLWYAKNHMRYSKRIAEKKYIRQEDVTRIHELAYHFITAYLKRIDIEKRARKTEVDTGAGNQVHRLQGGSDNQATH